MSPEMYCIMISGNLTNGMRDALIGAAYLMLATREKSRKTKGPDCEGVVTTAFHPLTIYGMSGIQFEGMLETDRGTITVHYLMRDNVLSEGGKPEFVTTLEDGVAGEWRPNIMRELARKAQTN